MIDLKGKVAIVTGAASPAGLGYSIAKTLTRQGAKVLITDIDEKGILARASDLVSEGYTAKAMAQNVAKESDWSAVVASAISEFGQIDILVNNAGIAVFKTLQQMTFSDWGLQLRVNLDSVFLGSKLVGEKMLQAGKGGSIINISSISAYIGAKGNVAYTATKGGVLSMTKAIALEYAKDKIRVNSVHPGMIQTDIHAKASAQNPELYATVMPAEIPMGYIGEPYDIAAMVAFLASEDSKYVTGSAFVVDGGYISQ